MADLCVARTPPTWFTRSRCYPSIAIANPRPNSRFHHDQDSFNLLSIYMVVHPILIPVVYLVFHYRPIRLDFIDCM